MRGASLGGMMDGSNFDYLEKRDRSLKGDLKEPAHGTGRHQQRKGSVYVLSTRLQIPDLLRNTQFKCL